MRMGFAVLSPFPPPSSAAEPGVVGEDCLRLAEPSSAAARLGEQRRAPPKGAAERGRLFLGYFLLAKQKKVTSRRAAPGYQSFARSAQNHAVQCASRIVTLPQLCLTSIYEDIYTLIASLKSFQLP